MKAKDVNIAWTPAHAFDDGPRAAGMAPAGSIEVGLHRPPNRWADKHPRIVGACCMDWQKVTREEQTAQVLALFVAIVVRDGVDPQAAHREFLKIDEYLLALRGDVDLPPDLRRRRDELLDEA